MRLFAAELERIHPNPYHATSREEYARRVDELAARAGSLDRDHLVVELMRLLALLGERDGHSGIYTLHNHPRPLHLYPLRTYWFSDGLAVVDGDEPGAKLVAIEGVPIDEVVARVRPADHPRQRVELPRACSVLPGLRRGAARARNRQAVNA